MASLSTKKTRRQIRDALKVLPTELDDTYSETMHRIKDQTEYDKTLADRVLYWISYARRSLSLEELQHALAVIPREKSFDNTNIVLETYLIGVCAGLVVIEPKSKLVRLVHYTTQDFFERFKGNYFPQAETSIAEACITYLSYTDVQEIASGHRLWDRALCERPEHFLKGKEDFIIYAWKYWSEHLSGKPKIELLSLALHFLDKAHRRYCDVDDGRTLLHKAADKGLLHLCQDLVSNKGFDIEAKTQQGHTPLVPAIVSREGRSPETVRTLLTLGADISSAKNMLGWAFFLRQEEICTLLVEGGANCDKDSFHVSLCEVCH